MGYDRQFMNLSASEIYAIVDVMRWEVHLSESSVYRNYSILPVDDARRILRRIAGADVNKLDELVRAFISPAFETRNFPDDYLVELLERELGEDSPLEDGAPPWGARMYVLKENQSAWLEYDPEPPVDPDALHQAAMAQVRARPRGYVVFEFVTEEGAPVSGLKCEVLLADGELLTRSSDAGGQLRLDGIPQGYCHLRLPSLDGASWRCENGPQSKPVDRTFSRVHVVQAGETLSSIAHHYGFREWRKIWDDPSNESLKKKRRNPSSLWLGDEVILSALKVHEVLVPTDATHRIIVASPELLRRAKWSS